MGRPIDPKNPKRVERAGLVRAATAREWAGRSGQFLEKEHENGLRLVVRREPDYIFDADGEVVGVDAWVQLFDGGRELPIDPHRRIINPPNVPRSGVVWSIDPNNAKIMNRVVTPNPVAAFWECVWDSVIEVPNEAGWRTRGTVTTIFSSSADAGLTSVADGGFGETYADARAGTGLEGVSVSTGSVANIGQYYENDGGAINSYQVYQFLVDFDTSGIPDAATVSAVVLSLWPTSNQSSTDFTVEARQDDWGPTASSSDYIPGASLSGSTLLASLSTSGIGTGAYINLTSQAAFLTATNLKTGTVYINVSSSRTRLNNTPSANVGEYIVVSTADQSGTTQDPKLTVTHTGGEGSNPFFTSRPNRIWRLG